MSELTPDSPSLPADPAVARPMGRGVKIAIAIGVVLLGAGLWLVTLIPGWLARDPTVAPPAGTAGRAPTGRRRD